MPRSPPWTSRITLSILVQKPMLMDVVDTSLMTEIVWCLFSVCSFKAHVEGSEITLFAQTLDSESSLTLSFHLLYQINLWALHPQLLPQIFLKLNIYFHPSKTATKPRPVMLIAFNRYHSIKEIFFPSPQLQKVLMKQTLHAWNKEKGSLFSIFCTICTLVDNVAMSNRKRRTLIRSIYCK